MSICRGVEGWYSGYGLETASGALRLSIGATTLYNYNGSNVTDGAWHHIAATRDDSYIRLYVDGRLDAAHAAPATPTFGGAGYYRFYGLGCGYAPGNTPLSLNYFTVCSMDEVQLFSRAWTEKEMRRYYEFMAGAL